MQFIAVVLTVDSSVVSCLFPATRYTCNFSCVYITNLSHSQSSIFTLVKTRVKIRLFCGTRVSRQD